MRIVSFRAAGLDRLGLVDGDEVIDLHAVDPRLPADLGAILRETGGDLSHFESIAARASERRPIAGLEYDLPVRNPGKIVCQGLNYRDHILEMGHELPEHPTLFVKFAEACGARGVRIEDPTRCREQLAEALRLDGPVIIECVVDPHEPPMPATVKKDQVRKLTEALRAGTPNRYRIALDMVKDLLDEASFEASPGHAIPDRLGRVASRVVGGLRGSKDDRPGA